MSSNLGHLTLLRNKLQGALHKVFKEIICESRRKKMFQLKWWWKMMREKKKPKVIVSEQFFPFQVTLKSVSWKFL